MDFGVRFAPLRFEKLMPTKAIESKSFSWNVIF
jgi:hypothetical protein